MTEPVEHPLTRRERRAARRGGPGRSRALVAAATSTLLVAAVAVAGVQLHASRDRADNPEVAALDLSGDLARTADVALTAHTDRVEAERAAAEAEAARLAEEQAAAEAEAARLAQEQAASAEAARVAEEQAAREAAEREAADATAAAPSRPGNPGIAGYVDGRPVDAAGNVLWVTSVPTADGDGSNGRMPMSSMCQVPWGTDQLGFAQYLRCDAADGLTALNAAFTAQFGEPLALDLTYRSYEDQVAMKAAFGGLAAAPGTSSHGTGTALDVQEWPDTYGFGTARYDWLVANGPAHGWYAPARVRQGQPYAEYWHFEYGPGRSS